MQVAGENGAWERDAPHSPAAPGWGLECPGASTVCEHAPFPAGPSPFSRGCESFRSFPVIVNKPAKFAMIPKFECSAI